MENGSQDNGRVPIDRGYGWIVVIGAMGANLLGIGTVKISGLFFLAFRDMIGGTVSEISAIFAARALIGAFTPILSGTLSTRYGGRPVVIAVALLGCVGFLTTVFAQSILHTVFTFGIIWGAVSGMLIPPTIGMLPKYFKKKRAKANGFASIGPGMGTFILSPLFVYLMEVFAVRGAFMVYAGCLLNIAVFGSLLRPVEFYTNRHRKARLKEEKELMNTRMSINGKTTVDLENNGKVRDVEKSLLDKDTSNTNVVNTQAGNGDEDSESCIKPNRVEVTPEAKKDSKVGESKPTASKEVDEKSKSRCTLDWTLFKQPLYILYLIGGGLAFFCYQSSFLCFPPHLRDIGMEPKLIGYLLSILGVSDVIGRLICGFLLDINIVRERMRVSAFYAGCVMVSGVAALVVPYFTRFPLLVVYVVIMGSAGAQIMSLMPLVLIEFIGVERLANALGYCFMVLNLGQAVSPIIMGGIRDSSGSFHLFFTLSGGCGVLGAVILALAPCVRRFFKKTEAEDKNANV